MVGAIHDGEFETTLPGNALIGGMPGAGKSVAGAIAGLLGHLPAPDAPPHERVAWCFRKADVLRRIAAAGGPDAQEAARLAGEADARGFELAREAVSLP